MTALVMRGDQIYLRKALCKGLMRQTNDIQSTWRLVSVCLRWWMEAVAPGGQPARGGGGVSLARELTEQCRDHLSLILLAVPLPGVRQGRTYVHLLRDLIMQNSANS